MAFLAPREGEGPDILGRRGMDHPEARCDLTHQIAEVKGWSDKRGLKRGRVGGRRETGKRV